MGKARASEDSFTRRFFKNDLTQSSGSSPEERRRHIRFTIDEYQITCIRESLISRFGFKKNIAHSVLDLSAGGIQIKTIEHLPIASRVSIQLTLARFSDTIEAQGVVRWSRALKSNTEPNTVQLHHIGIAFKDMTDSMRRKIEAMQSWFTSPQRQAKSKTQGGKGSFFFPG